MSLCKLSIPPNATDQEIREIAKQYNFNGEYATTICKHCGMFWADENGNTNTAKIIPHCKECH